MYIINYIMFLRFCFYDNIAGVASFIGWHCSSTLKPLLEQGLADTEEMVVCRTITAVADIVRHGDVAGSKRLYSQGVQSYESQRT